MPRAKKYWAEALASPAREFPLTGLEILHGKIPEQLDGGSLYRNGPGRLQRGEFKVGHWFDGDGAILAVHFAKGAAKATYRYVQTKGYLAESQADRYLYPNYGMKLTGALWRNWGKDVKNLSSNLGAPSLGS